MLFVAISCTVILTGEMVREWAARDAAVREVETALTNLATSLAQHADDSLEMADLVLSDLVAAIEADGTAPEALARINRSIGIGLATSPRLRGLFVYDADGHWLATSATTVPPNANNADRAYFRHHRASPDKGVHVSAAVRSRSAGQWIVPVTRRFDKPDGSFGGVVLASIDARYFADFYRKFDVGAGGSIALIAQSGRVLARMPFDEADIDRDISGSALFTNYLRSGPVGAYHYVSPIDRVSRISGFQKAQRYPVVVVVAMARTEVLAVWREGAWRRGSGSLLLTLAIAVLGLWLAQQIGRRQVLEGELARSEADFRLIAEGASDMVSRIGPDGVRRYVSPAAIRLLGLPPEEMVGRSAFDIVDAEDMAPIAEAAARLRAGATTEETITFRARHSDGRQLWLESSLRVTGTGEGIVSITRDITERKALEARLSQMARTDALTGLTNRRAFDEALLVEAGRAVRGDTPLSLILVDLDRFKQFNDTYGHPAGDTCLRVVATKLMAAAKRPGDLAARLGGEELALLLPQTDQAGACIVAERVRGEIERAAHPHRANLPWQVVTASMGVATITGHAGADVADATAALMTAADEALYAAKAAGRNQVVVAPAAGDA